MELKSCGEMNAEQQLAYKLGAASRLTPADVLAAVRTLPGVKETWMCEYPEFNDPACYVGHPDPKPEDAHPASKHMDCRWVLVVPLSEEE